MNSSFYFIYLLGLFLFVPYFTQALYNYSVLTCDILGIIFLCAILIYFKTIICSSVMMNNITYTILFHGRGTTYPSRQIRSALAGIFPFFLSLLYDIFIFQSLFILFYFFSFTYMTYTLVFLISLFLSFVESPILLVRFFFSRHNNLFHDGQLILMYFNFTIIIGLFNIIILSHFFQVFFMLSSP